MKNIFDITLVGAFLMLLIVSCFMMAENIFESASELNINNLPQYEEECDCCARIEELSQQIERRFNENY